MTTKRKPYQTYPKEFKLEALRLMEMSDRPASEIGRRLGISTVAVSKSVARGEGIAKINGY